MKIDLKSRFKNKTVFAALIACVVTFAYQILGILGITTSISQDQIVQIVGIAINVLATVGVLVDPTTPGISDKQIEEKK